MLKPIVNEILGLEYVADTRSLCIIHSVHLDHATTIDILHGHFGQPAG